MIYITIPVKERTRQIKLEDFLNDDFDFSAFEIKGIPYTRTFKATSVPWYLKYKTPVRRMVYDLKLIAERAKQFDTENMSQYYRHYTIPKKSGGKRPIDEPLPELKSVLSDFKKVLEDSCCAKWHTSAYAYINGRCTHDERYFHARRGSRWFEYLDFHNFFGSFTFDYAWETISHIYPFNLILENDEHEYLKTCLKICFLNGGLPQGTPISPMLTNILMIPFDFEISKKLIHNYDEKFYYTRYADDICISCAKDFDPKVYEDLVLSTLKELGCPFVLNTKKTHYCSFNGHNFHLGLCYNNDKQITVGYRKKDSIKAMLTNYALDTKNGKYWSVHDAQTLLGQFNYCRQQEKDYFDYVVEHLSEKFGIDILNTIRAQIRTGGNVCYGKK